MTGTNWVNSTWWAFLMFFGLMALLEKDGIDIVGSLDCCMKGAHGETKGSARACLGQMTLQTQGLLGK